MSLTSVAGGPYENVKAFNLLGYWPFVGTLYDVSTNALGAATVQGTNVALTFEQNTGFVQIRQPGFLNIPAVDLRTINFSIELSLRVASLPSARQIILSNWQANNWQYLLAIFPDGTLQLNLRRNMQTNGSNPTQDLVVVKTTASVPVGKFFDLVWVFDTTRRTLSAFIDGALAASAVVGPQFTDLTLHTSTQNVIQLGNKADDGANGELNADINQLAFYQLTF